MMADGSGFQSHAGGVAYERACVHPALPVVTSNFARVYCPLSSEPMSVLFRRNHNARQENQSAARFSAW